MIHVTWKDIRDGKRRRTTECMVALALRRELEVSFASVGLDDAVIRVDGRYINLRLPKQVTRKIRRWERFQFVLPFSFEFPVPFSGASSVLTNGAQAGRAAFD